MLAFYLQWQEEDPVVFERRVAEAKRGREAAEAELRYFFYLDGLARDEEVIHTYDFHRNLGRAAMQVRSVLVWGQDKGHMEGSQSQALSSHEPHSYNLYYYT